MRLRVSLGLSLRVSLVGPLDWIIGPLAQCHSLSRLCLDSIRSPEPHFGGSGTDARCSSSESEAQRTAQGGAGWAWIRLCQSLRLSDSVSDSVWRLAGWWLPQSEHSHITVAPHSHSDRAKILFSVSLSLSLSPSLLLDGPCPPPRVRQVVVVVVVVVILFPLQRLPLLLRLPLSLPLRRLVAARLW